MLAARWACRIIEFDHVREYSIANVQILPVDYVHFLHNCNLRRGILIRCLVRNGIVKEGNTVCENNSKLSFFTVVTSPFDMYGTWRGLCLF